MSSTFEDNVFQERQAFWGCGSFSCCGDLSRGVSAPNSQKRERLGIHSTQPRFTVGKRKVAGRVDTTALTEDSNEPVAMSDSSNFCFFRSATPRSSPGLQNDLLPSELPVVYSSITNDDVKNDTHKPNSSTWVMGGCQERANMFYDSEASRLGARLCHSNGLITYARKY